MKIFALTLSMAVVQAHAVSAQKLVWEARQQIGRTTAYDPAYSNIGYPMGDVPVHKGVCTDVVIRSLRRQKIDLQQLIHEDMSKNFAAYPKKWGLTQPDRNIDHRRVPNIATYFQRKGYQTHDEKFLAGDIVPTAKAREESRLFCTTSDVGPVKKTSSDATKSPAITVCRDNPLLRHRKGV